MLWARLVAWNKDDDDDDDDYGDDGWLMAN